MDDSNEDKALPTRSCPWRIGKKTCNSVVNAVIPAAVVAIAKGLIENETFPFGARCEAKHPVLLYVDRHFDVRETRAYLPIEEKDDTNGENTLRKWVSGL